MRVLDRGMLSLLVKGRDSLTNQHHPSTGSPNQPGSRGLHPSGALVCNLWQTRDGSAVSRRPSLEGVLDIRRASQERQSLHSSHLGWGLGRAAGIPGPRGALAEPQPLRMCSSHELGREERAGELSAVSDVAAAATVLQRHPHRPLVIGEKREDIF